MRAAILSLLIAGAYGASWDKVGQEIRGDEAGDLSGWSVDTSADGSIVVVGTPKNNEDDPDASSTAGGDGHVRVYHLVGGAWTQRGDDIVEVGTSDASHDQFGYSVAISADGDTIAIGEPVHYQFGGILRAYYGRVHIYKFGNDEWTKSASITGPLALFPYRFGHSVSLSGDGNTVAVGSPDSPKGTVHVYQGTTYQPVGPAIQGGANDDKFGTSVSLSSDGQYLAVGAIDSNSADGVLHAGHAKVYQNSGNGWVRQTTIEGTTANGEKGISVSLSASGTRIAIGASHTDVGVPGRACVYDVAGLTSTKVGADIVGSGDYDLSGHSVSLSGDGTRLAVGAPQNDDAGAGTGLVRLYDLSGNTWRATGGSIVGENAGNKAGYSVALSSDGTHVAVGAPRALSDPQRPGGTTIYEYSASSSALSTEAIVGIAVGGTALVVAIAAIVISKTSSATDGGFTNLLTG